MWSTNRTKFFATRASALLMLIASSTLVSAKNEYPFNMLENENGVWVLKNSKESQMRAKENERLFNAIERQVSTDFNVETRVDLLSENYDLRAMSSQFIGDRKVEVILTCHINSGFTTLAIYFHNFEEHEFSRSKNELRLPSQAKQISVRVRKNGVISEEYFIIKKNPNNVQLSPLFEEDYGFTKNLKWGGYTFITAGNAKPHDVIASLFVNGSIVRNKEIIHQCVSETGSKKNCFKKSKKIFYPNMIDYAIQINFKDGVFYNSMDYRDSAIREVSENCAWRRLAD
jgi:hypothetical protein